MPSDGRVSLPGPWDCLRQPEGCNCHCHARSKRRHPHNNGKAPWTKQELDRATKMRNAGHSYTSISLTVKGRTPGAIRQALTQRGDPDNGIDTVWFTRRSLMHKLGLTQWILDNLAADGELPRVRYRDFWYRYNLEDIEKYIDKHAGVDLEVSKIKDAGFRKRAESAAKINARRA